MADELAKDVAALQMLRDRPDATVTGSDVAPLVAAAVDHMASRAILYIDTARPQWQAMHANAVLRDVSDPSACSSPAHDVCWDMPDVWGHVGVAIERQGPFPSWFDTHP